MGHRTEFLGHIDIDPVLNRAEVDYLVAFARSRRCHRPGGPYAVARVADDRDDRDDGADLDAGPAPGQPDLHCRWAPCPDGCCLSFDGSGDFPEPVRWMRYLVDHLLKPGALASRTGLGVFGEFTFDHRLDGMVVGERRGTRELVAVDVEGNRVRERVLRNGRPAVWGSVLPHGGACEPGRAAAR